ncbi:MAG: hypothetical protein Q9186_005006 [Xanthomendoza sp. 1 TL-2023]
MVVDTVYGIYAQVSHLWNSAALHGDELPNSEHRSESWRRRLPCAYPHEDVHSLCLYHLAPLASYREKKSRKQSISHNLYSEGIDLLYSSNVFCFDDTRTVEAFAKTILPRRIILIRTIDLTGLREETESLYHDRSIPPAVSTGTGLNCLQQLRITACQQCQSEDPYTGYAFQWEVFIRRDHESVTEAKVLSQKPYIECERCRRHPVQWELHQHMVVCESGK